MTAVGGVVGGRVGGSVTGLLAQNPPGSERGEEFGKTSPIALVVVLLLALATVLLIRSMSKRLKNVPVSFDDTPTSADGTAAPSDPGEGDAGDRPGGAVPPTGRDGSPDRRDLGG